MERQTNQKGRNSDETCSSLGRRHKADCASTKQIQNLMSLYFFLTSK